MSQQATLTDSLGGDAQVAETQELGLRPVEDHVSVVDTLADVSFDQSPGPGPAPDAAPTFDEAVIGGSREDLRNGMLHEVIEAAHSDAVTRASALMAPEETAVLLAVVQENAIELHACLDQGCPFNLDRLDYADERVQETLVPLREAAERINTERGFDTNEKVVAYWVKVSKQLERLENWQRAEGIEWRDFPPEAAETLRQYMGALESGAGRALTGIDPAPLATYPTLIPILQQIHEEWNLPFAAPATLNSSFETRALAIAGELLGSEMMPELTLLGGGSEGMVFKAETAEGIPVAIKLKNPGADMVGKTVTVATSLQVTGAEITALVPLAETNEIAITPYIADMFTLTDLSAALNEADPSRIPGNVRKFVDEYRNDHPADSDLSGLRRKVSEVSAQLGGATLYHGLTANSTNFAVLGFDSGKLELMCIDPR